MVIFTDYQTSTIPNGAFFLVPFDSNYKNNNSNNNNISNIKEINTFEKDIPLNAPSYLVESASENHTLFPKI